MPSAKKDDMLGEIKGRIPLYSNGIDNAGQIILCESGIILEAEGNTLKVPFRYITMLEKSGELPLGKVSVEIEVFDPAGNKYYYQFGMADTHFLMLKRACSK
ncbi:MAG: hypothetical protein N3G80_00580 [Candidatus Micrarchaeota archaeon]|nr:hypothetical protein [Candidatus Micrarchaeota archaeon]